MRLARAAVAEASRAPPAGADAASTALRGAARTVGFVAFSCFQLPMLAPERALSFVQHVAYYLVRAGVVVALH